MVSRTRFSFGLIVLLVLCVSVSLAQDYHATVVGLVTDANKAAIPGAKVKVANERTGVSVEVATTSEGLYIEQRKQEWFFLYFATHDIHVPRAPHTRFVGKSGMGPRGD